MTLWVWRSYREKLLEASRVELENDAFVEK